MNLDMTTVLGLGVLGAAALVWTRHARWGRRLLLLAAAAVLAIALLPLGALLLHPLENRFGREIAADVPVAGIVVLGGIGWQRGEPALPASGGRPIAAMQLALRYPQARLVLSGGIPGSEGAERKPEAAAARRLLVSLGLPPERMILEPDSTNTAENAVFSARLITPAAGECWLLVTSASHMPRAIGAFRAAGLDLAAYPVDYRTPARLEEMPWLLPSPGQQLHLIDLALHEWLGLLWYRLRGRTRDVFPGPRPPTGCRA